MTSYFLMVTTEKLAYWTRQFFDCHLKYLKRKQKPLAIKQKNAHNFKDIEEYFETFCKLVE